MTLEEKVIKSQSCLLRGWQSTERERKAADGDLKIQVSLTAGDVADTGCAGMLAPVERLGFPGMCLHDAGHGVRNTDFVNSWPSGIHIGAR